MSNMTQDEKDAEIKRLTKQIQDNAEKTFPKKHLKEMYKKKVNYFLDHMFHYVKYTIV